MLLRVIIQHAYWQIRGYDKAVFGYLLGSKLAQTIAEPRKFRQLDSLSIKSISEIPSSRRVLYFALQTEPESSTIGLAQNDTNQLAIIMELSLQLPADCVLVVKEHIWAIAARPNDFYKKIVQLHNVLLVSPSVPGSEIIERADVVSTISSSAGYEAAVLGKPTIFFWDKCPIACLPHVHIMSRYNGLEKIKTIIKKPTATELAKNQTYGALYIEFLKNNAMDTDPINFYGRNRPFTLSEMQDFTQALLWGF